MAIGDYSDTIMRGKANNAQAAMMMGKGLRGGFDTLQTNYYNNQLAPMMGDPNKLNEAQALAGKMESKGLTPIMSGAAFEARRTLDQVNQFKTAEAEKERAAKAALAEQQRMQLLEQTRQKQMQTERDREHDLALMGMKMTPNQMAQYNLALELMDNPNDRNTKSRALMGALRLETGAAIANQEMLQTLTNVLGEEDAKQMLAQIIYDMNPAGAEAKALLKRAKTGNLPSVFDLGSSAASAFLQNNIGDQEAATRVQASLQKYMEKIDPNELRKQLATRMMNSDINNALLANNLSPEQAESLYGFRNGDWQYVPNEQLPEVEDF